MQYRLIITIALGFFQIFTLPSSTLGVDSERAIYQEYKPKKKSIPLFEISFNKETFTLTTFEDDLKNHFSFRRADIKKQGATIIAAGKVLFDNIGLHFAGEIYTYTDITAIKVSDNKSSTTITFITLDDNAKRVSRIRRGNIFQTGDKIKITKDDFVRGAIFTLTDDIEILGEVNKDVITLFGSISVRDQGVVRGDLVSIFSEIKIDADAAVYGKITSKDNKSSERHLKERGITQLEIDFDEGFGYYNRVDGFALLGEITYVNRDSVIPSMWLKGGYAFASNRWRYNIGLEKAIIRKTPLVIGGRLFRELATDDDWLIDEDENSVTAIMATEDYRDYYEATGGQVFLKFEPWHDFKTELGYRFEKSRWFPANMNLWSVLGRDLFRLNFSSVHTLKRAQGISEIDNTENGYLYAKISFDNREPLLIPRRSAWRGEFWFELSDSKFNSDFDYNRFRLTVIRHQHLSRKHTVIIRGILSGSDGYLPMHKRFFLGGLGSVRGYEHKEFIGTRFWMFNSEYRFELPEIDDIVGLFWDIGQIANDTKLSSDIEVKNSAGISYYIDKDFRFTVAKRLDRSTDNDPKFYVRITHSF